MGRIDHYYTKFEEENFYHVYNRTVDKKPMFKNPGNYSYFLSKFDKYLSPVADTYTYCLLENHFHFLIRILNLTNFKNHSDINSEFSTHDIVSHQFRKFFQSYAMSFNNQQNRTGTLFQTPFKRALVDSENYLTRLIYYIHANPQSHGLTDDFRDWKWSSYIEILNDKVCKLKKKEVLDLFGGREEFFEFHSE